MYIKRLELTNFKSFGGTTPIPLLPGFTVVSGPNGSGKSNLIDALLFCLGLAGSKGMRAERLPDLVNHNQISRNRSAVEASVTVTFDLSDEPELLDDVIERQVNGSSQGVEANLTNGSENGAAQLNGHSENGHLEDNNGNGNGSTNGNGGQPKLKEWSVTRKLRVTQQGTYTSNYYINGLPCTLTELHEELNRLRIYPEGYNVVLQGDVTRIISMNPRERREIIDELAGVATFDRKINQAKEKLNAVKEREDRYHIVERELVDQRDRLAQDRIKAEKYQRLRTELQTKEQWEVIIRYQQSAKAVEKLRQQIEAGDREAAEITQQLTSLTSEIRQATLELEQMNARVRALGEEEQLALQSTLATREAELRQLQRQQQDLQVASREVTAKLAQTQQDLQEHLKTLESLTQEQNSGRQNLGTLQTERDQARESLQQIRATADTIAASAETSVQEQAALHRQIETLLNTLEPQRTEQAQLMERTRQLERQRQEQTQTHESLQQQIAERQEQQSAIAALQATATQQVQSLAEGLAAAEQELQIQQETQARLLNEQRDKQRRLDKLEAQTQAIQEAQGTYATQLILKSDLPGVCGLVAQLGRVDPRFQLALETAAGARLGNLVVEDDAIAAAGIELLKQRKAGRATFLPLNKLQRGRVPSDNVRSLSGCVDYAIKLIDFDQRYRDVFAYVFGNTVVFETLRDARRHLGDYRIVTLEGELLESSGAMTGGSSGSRQSIHFGTVDPAESAEVVELRDRLKEIDRILNHCQNSIQRAANLVKERSQSLTEARQQHRETQLRAEQLSKEQQTFEKSLAQIESQLEQTNQELNAAQTRLQALTTDLPQQEEQLQELRQTLAEMEESQTHSEWQQIQTSLRSQEAELNQRELAVRTTEQRLQDLENQIQRTQEKIHQGQERLQEYRTQQTAQLNQQNALTEQQSDLNQQIETTQAALADLERRLGAEKQERDRCDRQLRERQTRQQQFEWQQQKLQETQQTRREELATLEEQLETERLELPDPLPEVPAEVESRDLAALQHELRSLQKRIQAMEPVNMLALEEYDRTQKRLEELTEKLRTLEEERTELLLRIENFTTLRQRAFKEAFDAVNVNFQAIFATLSEGDGHLQLEDAQDPFNGGLNLVAHPKGKPVQRLASMSGGEKSLTALSFIFALQRYRPSPFYAFDEVDMFLDGANVERLARMIKQQAQQAQFIVVSLRRPMIESAQRTIGVTQARGAYTQVLGINLLTQSASM